MFHRTSIALSVALFALAVGGCIGARAQDSWEDDFKTNPPPGKNAFASTCAGCHGLDGRGSEKAPNIAGTAKLQHLSDSQLGGIISNGVPGTGMPAFHSLSAGQVRSLVAYLRFLQGRQTARALPGNPAAGRSIFHGKGGCSTCHTFSGEGGFLGPDLSAYGSAMPAKAILDAIVKSERKPQPGYKSAAVTTHDGNRIEGILRNEDNFSVQLQTTDGSFHFFQKSDVQNLEYLNHSMMPANYAERLNTAELNDLVSYLMRSAATSPAQAHKNNNGD